MNNIHSPYFLPGGAKYFDLPGMLAVATPNQTWLSGENEVPLIVDKAYKVARAKDQLKTNHDGSIDAMLDFLRTDPK